jgi:hypothetical protein
MGWEVVVFGAGHSEGKSVKMKLTGNLAIYPRYIFIPDSALKRPYTFL